MKCKLSVILCFAALGLYPVAAQNSKTVFSTPREATVFFRGAELTHTARTTLPQGSSELRITGLSPMLDRNSIRIATTGGVLVSAFEYAPDYLAEDKSENPEVKKLEEAIDTKSKKLKEMGGSLKVNRQMLEAIDKSLTKNVEGSTNGLSTEELTRTLGYYQTKSLELMKVISAENEQCRQLDEEIKKLKAQLEEIKTKNNKTSGMLTLNLTAPAAGNCDFTIVYYTPSAGWTPYYDIFVESTQKPVRITSKAKVRQVTGIDWENIRLSLSTSTPGTGKSAPLFDTWFLRHQNPVASALRGKVAGVAPSQNRYSYDASPQLEEVVVMAYGTEQHNVTASAPPITMNDLVVLSENQLNLTYNIDLPYTIAGTGKEQNIELQNREVPAEFKYYCAPKLDPKTYVLAEIADWEKLNLLSGTANITYEGTYVGETRIDASSTQEKLTLTLGSDERVPVKREKLTDFSSTRTIGSDTRQVFTYQLTVRNNKSVTVRMVLKDQYPRSTQREIEVELLTKDTTPQTFNNEEVGVLSWEFELQPGETKTCRISYSVKYPKGFSLNL